MRRFQGLVAVLLTVVMAGCASDQSKYGSYAQPAEDVAFNEGADRPPTPRTLTSMARILSHQGKEVQAQHVLRRVIRDHPNHLPAYCDLAEMYMRYKKVEPAIAVLTRAHEIAPQDPVILNNLGMCEMSQEQYGLALTWFEQAARLRLAAMRHSAPGGR